MFGILVPMAFGVLLVLGGFWLQYSGFAGVQALRIGGWSVVGTVVLAGGAGFTILYQGSHGVAMDDPLFVVVDAASFGGLVGLVVGVYDVRQLRARTRAVRARDESERLNRRLTVLNRVLRHDIRNAATVIRGQAELLAHNGQEASAANRIIGRAEELVTIGDQVHSMERLVQDDTEHVRFPVSDLLGEYGERVDRKQAVAVETSLPMDEQILAYPAIEPALDGLFDRLFDGDESPTGLEISCERISQNGDEYVELRLSFAGVPLPEEAVAAVERGYETEFEHIRGLDLWLSPGSSRNPAAPSASRGGDDRTDVFLLLEPATGEAPMASSVT